MADIKKIKVIDTHFHLWNLDKQELPWLDTVDDTIRHSYSLADYRSAWASVEGVDFLGGVYVEVDAANSLLEDELVWDILSNDASHTILSCAMRSRVEPWMRLPLFSGAVREPLHIPQEPRGRCLEPEFIQGLRALAAAHIPFESCNRTPELGDAYEAFAKVPEETVILNHVGNVAELTNENKEALKRLATLPNLYVKVSGYPTKDREFVRELTNFLQDTFSEKRLLFSSNWPVIELYGSLDEHVSELKESFGDDELFWYKNALEAYNL